MSSIQRKHVTYFNVFPLTELDLSDGYHVTIVKRYNNTYRLTIYEQAYDYYRGFVFGGTYASLRELFKELRTQLKELKKCN